MKLKDIRNAQTIKDLDNLGLGYVRWDVSYRGGYLGFYSSNIASALKIRESNLPLNFGAHCNYLGGGIRGSIVSSVFSFKLTGRNKQLLNEIAAACVRVYKNIEDESGINDVDGDNEINWDARATESARKEGIISAY
jgi:hypothetical protein